MANNRKQITFDLDTKALEIYYPGDRWRNSYEVVKKHMVKSRFEWVQRSVYISQKPMGTAKVTRILTKLVRQNPWLNLCMRDCRETNIGKEHSKNYMFDKNADVPAWKE